MSDGSDEYADLRERAVAAQERINELKMKLSIARDRAAATEEQREDKSSE